MDVLFLSRIQFALTVGFHYLYPPLSIGISLFLVLLEGLYLKTRDPLYQRLTKFWVRLFALTFAVGVATGIVMEFEFGTNWASYSRFVGDVFGSPLAAEGIFAFFLESIFLGLLVFGWNRVKPRTHFISTVLVCAGAHLSAFWIVVANSWQQTPAGYRVVESAFGPRAEITDFWAMVFNPSSVERVTHVLFGCWQTGAFLVLGVGSFYLLVKKHEDAAKVLVKAGLAVALVSSFGQLATGHASAVVVERHQPAKLAAFEGLYDTQTRAPIRLFGWVDDGEERVRFDLKIPGVLSLLVHGTTEKPVRGLRDFPPGERPPVNIVFQAYHAMVGIGFGLIGLSLLGAYFWWRRTLWSQRWLLLLFIPSVLAPQAANQLGWISAEVGRQPWIVYGLLRTSEGLSRSVTAGEVWFSLILFTVIYALLLAVFITLFVKEVLRGPRPEEGMALP